MLKHYVEFFYTSKSTVGPVSEEIEERDHLLVKLPKGACGYRFYDREENETNGVTVKLEPCNYSPYLYFGKPLTLKEVKKREGKNSAFYRFMKQNGYTRAVLIGDEFPICVEDEDRILTIL